MENKELNSRNNVNHNMTQKQNSKEEMARIIARNMTTHRRESSSQQSFESDNYTRTAEK